MSDLELIKSLHHSVGLLTDQCKSLRDMIMITNKRIDALEKRFATQGEASEVGLKGLLEEALGKKDERDI